MKNQWGNGGVMMINGKWRNVGSARERTWSRSVVGHRPRSLPLFGYDAQLVTPPPVHSSPSTHNWFCCRGSRGSAEADHLLSILGKWSAMRFRRRCRGRSSSHRRRRYILPSCSTLLRSVDEDEQYWRDERGDEELAWNDNIDAVNSQLSQCFANAMVGSRSWFGGFFNRFGNRSQGSSEKTHEYSLTALQEQKLQSLKDRLQVPFDETRPDHQDALRALWKASFPAIDLRGLVSEQWKDMGWQGPNPSTDFRGCGFISLENLLFFARTYPASYQRLLFKQGGIRATWEYPFAVAGINISFMLIQMLDLYSARPKSLPGINFIRILSEDEEAFDVLYCIAYEMVDAQWLALRASYMQFNEVLQATRTQLERELCLEDVRRIQDLPAYNLLYQ